MTEKISPRRRHLTVDEYVQGVMNGNRAIIAQAITLVETIYPNT
jgi:LAO/AO transport system kinase